jgi:hypothetical protein
MLMSFLLKQYSIITQDHMVEVGSVTDLRGLYIVRRAFSGAPGGDWVHVEISNDKADDPQYYIDTMKKLLGDPPVLKLKHHPLHQPLQPLQNKKPVVNQGL